MRGCLIPLLAGLGVLLLLPGMCFLAVGRAVGGSNYQGGVVILSTAGVFIAAAIVMSIILKD